VAGWLAGSDGAYDREFAVDVEQLFTFLVQSQPEETAKLGIANYKDKEGVVRQKFLARLQGEITRRGVIDVLRNGFKNGPLSFDLFYGTPSAENAKAVERHAKNRFSNSEVGKIRRIPRRPGEVRNPKCEVRTQTARSIRNSSFDISPRSTTRRLAIMNIALRGIEADFGPENADTFRRDLHPDLRADYVLANGSMSSNQSREGDIRQKLIEADLVDCMVALPGQLFYSTQISVCLWFLAKNKKGGAGSQSRPSQRKRQGETLFIDARKLGTLIDRVHRELTDADLEKITSTYHAWRGDGGLTRSREGREGREVMATDSDPLRAFASSRETSVYSDIPAFCKSATTAEIAAHGHVLTPGRYVGAAEAEDDGEPFDEKMPRLVAELHGQFAESAKLEAQIRADLAT